MLGMYAGPLEGSGTSMTKVFEEVLGECLLAIVS